MAKKYLINRMLTTQKNEWKQMTVKYFPDDNCCVLTESDTGTGMSQEFATDSSLTYYVAGVYQNKIVLMANDVTEEKLCLVGKIGFEKGPETMNKAIGECYSNSKLEAIACNITQELLTKVYAKDMYGKSYWFADQFVDVFEDEMVAGIYCKEVRADDFNKRDFMTFGQHNGFKFYKHYSNQYPLMPVILLPLEVMIDEDGNLSLSK